ncbi:hypothetical protein AB0M54_17230 [Actinoplanes sp. NPDC051470]|uniref:hypothetical protein n=1 Tax=unclassified Actinoplanes TaxID=2626549 RepID=UPI00343166F5
MGITRARFLTAAGAVVAAPLVGAAPAAARPRKIHPGVCYSVGDGWDARRMRADVRAIARDLHADSISVYGTGPERLAATAEEAAERGLRVWVQPRMADVPPGEILDHIVETGRAAERLRRRHPATIFSVGCEFVLFVPGIVPGADPVERVRNLLAGNFDPVVMTRRLTAFTARAARAGRSVFRGTLTYGAAYDEDVDWSLFDLVSANYYGDRPARDLAPLQQLGKPVAVTEFGCCTYVGAEADGGLGWDVVDYTKDPPEIKGGLVRSERTQARYIVERFRDFAAMGLHSAIVYEFVSPDAPHHPDPLYDLDIASYSITRTVGDRWEPKLAFRAMSSWIRA